MKTFLKRKNLAVLTLSALLTFMFVFALAPSIVRKSAAAAEEGTFTPFVNAITVNGDGWCEPGFGDIGNTTKVRDGVTYNDGIQIKISGSNGAYLPHAEKGSNLAEKISFWVKIKDETEYSWHTMQSLIATTATGGNHLRYISEAHIRNDLLLIRFETVWDNSEFIPLDVKAIKLEQELNWPKYGGTGDQWNNNKDGSGNVPSGTHGVNKDIVIQFTQYSDGTSGGDNCDKFIPYCELGTDDTLTVKTQPSKLTYAPGDSFDASGMVLTATINGTAQDIPSTASMVEVENVTFEELGSQKCSVSYGGKSVEVSVTVEDIVVDRITAVSNKTSYIAGDSLELTVTAYAGAEDTEGTALQSIDYTVTGYDATKVGEQTVTVMYRGKTATVQVNVVAPALTRYIDLDPDVWPYHNVGDTVEVNGVKVGYSLEIKLTVASSDQNYLYGTDKKTNQGTHVQLYTKLKGDTEYKWYTVAELTKKKDSNKQPYIARIAQREATMILYFDTFYGDTPTREFTPLDVKAVKLCAGMQWGVQYGNKDWTDGGEGAIMPGEVGIKDDIILQIEQLYHGDASRTSCDIFSYYYEEVDTLTVKTAPNKTSYLPGETFDPAGMVLEAKIGDKTVEVKSTASMLQYDTSELTKDSTTVQVGWGEKMVEVPVTVTPPVQRIEITAEPAKVEFDLAEVLVPSFEGLVVKAYESASDTTGWTVNLSELEISGYDLPVAGTQTVKVTYRGYEDTFEITVTDRNPDKKMTFYHGSPITISDQTGTLAVRFNFEGITTQTGFWSLYKTDVASNVKEKVFLKVSELYEGDKLTVGEWYSVGYLMTVQDANGIPYIARASQFGETLLLHLDTYYGTTPTLEFTNECVEAMRIEAGFYFVEYIANNWGNEANWDKNIESYTLLPNAILRETFEIEKNIVGTSWLRPFKTDESGNVADDALTVKTMPDKTQYAVGDDFDPAGLVLHVKYRDGGGEDVAITDKTVCQFDFSEEGKAVVTVNFNDGSVTFEVNVGKDASGDTEPGPGCGCGSMLSTTSVISSVGALLIVGVLLMFVRRKKYEK